jgi:hypothetical protein
MIRRPDSRDRQMRAQIATLVAASLLAGCCASGYPAVSGASPAPFDAFQASMKLAVGMPTDVAILLIGSEPISGQAASCGILAGYEMDVPTPEIRLLRQQPAPCLYRPDAGRPWRRELLVGAQGLIRDRDRGFTRR